MKRGDPVLFQLVPGTEFWNIGILLAEVPDGYLICTSVHTHCGVKNYTTSVCVAARIEPIDLDMEHIETDASD